MKARLLATLTLTFAIAASASEKGLTAYIYKVGSSREIVSYYMLNPVYESKGDYVWAHYDGEDYVIRNAATIEAFGKVMATVPKYEEQRIALRKKINAAKNDAEKKKLERELEKLEDEKRAKQSAAEVELAKIVDRAVQDGRAEKAK